MIQDQPALIAVPVFERPNQIEAAITAALAQSHPDCLVLALDDGSRDQTWQAMQRFAGHPRLGLIRMARNLGTAQAKNLAILLAGSRAITFHDSDDRPHPDKLLRQSRVLSQSGLKGDAGLNWRMIGRAAGGDLSIDAVFCHHMLIGPDGSSQLIRREISIFDDLFPNAQPEPAPGDWLHINSGLFAARVFRELGGFVDSIEEDRDFRNRLLMSGQILRVIEEPLLTKIETAGSLTLAASTGYASARRRTDRQAVWHRVEEWLSNRQIPPCPIDLPRGAIAEIVNPAVLAPSTALMTGQSRQLLAKVFGPTPTPPPARTEARAD